MWLGGCDLRRRRHQGRDACGQSSDVAGVGVWPKGEVWPDAMPEGTARGVT